MQTCVLQTPVGTCCSTSPELSFADLVATAQDHVEEGEGEGNKVYQMRVQVAVRLRRAVCVDRATGWLGVIAAPGVEQGLQPGVEDPRARVCLFVLTYAEQEAWEPQLSREQRMQLRSSSQAGSVLRLWGYRARDEQHRVVWRLVGWMCERRWSHEQGKKAWRHAPAWQWLSVCGGKPALYDACDACSCEAGDQPAGVPASQGSCADVDGPRGVCLKWVGRGTCPYGEACTYWHPQPGEELRAARLAIQRKRQRVRDAKRLRGAGGGGGGGGDGSGVNPSAQDTDADAATHGATASHGQRALVFAHWLVHCLGHERANEGTGILDVAGGRGDVSYSLLVHQGVASTIVDPGRTELRPNRSRRKAMKRANVASLPWIRLPFDDALVGHDRWGPHVAQASCVVAMHPDQATEAVVDWALEQGKAFFVVPCCVFATLWPNRCLRSGQAVRTYDEFCAYLCEKAAPGHVMTHDLPFEGKCRVLCWSPDPRERRRIMDRMQQWTLPTPRELCCRAKQCE